MYGNSCDAEPTFIQSPISQKYLILISCFLHKVHNLAKFLSSPPCKHQQTIQIILVLASWEKVASNLGLGGVFLQGILVPCTTYNWVITTFKSLHSRKCDEKWNYEIFEKNKVRHDSIYHCPMVSLHSGNKNQEMKFPWYSKLIMV